MPRWVAGPIGLISGVLTGLFGTGGPPLILYYRLQGVDKAAFRGNLMAIFLLMTVVRVPSYAVFGLITAPRMWSALAVLPAVILGALIGNSIHLRIEEDTFRRLVSAALLADRVVTPGARSSINRRIVLHPPPKTVKSAKHVKISVSNLDKQQMIFFAFFAFFAVLKEGIEVNLAAQDSTECPSSRRASQAESRSTAFTNR